LSTAYPFAARILGQGSTFLYRQGIICVRDGDMVRVLYVHSQIGPVLLELTPTIRPILESAFASSGDFRVRLLNYADCILAVHVTPCNGGDVSYIFAIDTTADPPKGRRVVRAVQLAASSKIFVRHNACYLYYGTHTGTGDDGHHKWEIDGISLKKDFPLPKRERLLLLDKFHGSDIGSTVAFEIHNDFFYAVSNQGTFEVEGIDYTSFYHVVRFPLNSPLQMDVENQERLFRRQHRQGSIHDSWTDLALQLDERTNETVIVESRREWAQASPRQSRTFYATKLEFEDDSGPILLEDDAYVPLEDDAYVPLEDSSNNPNWKPTPQLYSFSQHAEFPKTATLPRSFILARTKFRAYNYPCASFLDLVEDERCCNDPSPPCFRLRVGTLRELGLDYSHRSNKGKVRSEEMESTFVDEKTRYRHSPIHMWPPPASRCPCSKRLHSILNPPLPPGGPSHTRSVTGMLDERCFIFMVKAGRSYGSSDDSTLGTIVAVDFTRPLTSNASASSASTLMSRCDSKMDDEFSPSSWEWTPGQERRCREGTCR
jgi:hypothetical protein